MSAGPPATPTAVRRRARPAAIGLGAAALVVAGLFIPWSRPATEEFRRAWPEFANPAQVRGRLACLDCELTRLQEADRFAGTALAGMEPDRANAPRVHSTRLHLVDRQGRFWELHPEGPGAAPLSHDDAGRQVTVFGTVLPDLHVIRVSRINFVLAD